MSSEPLIYSELRLQQVGTLVFIQPMQGSAVIGPSLTVELGTGTVGLAEHNVPLKGTDTIYGVIGLARFLGGCALAVITDAEKVRSNTCQDILGTLLPQHILAPSATLAARCAS